MQGTVGIVVNTEKVKDPVTGFGDVFQEKYKGRIVVLDDALEIVTWALATLGLGPDAVTKENLEKVRPILAKWLPLVKVYDSDSPKTALLNGDVDLGIVWSGEAAILIKEQPGKFTYVLPEGRRAHVHRQPRDAEGRARTSRRRTSSSTTCCGPR